MTLLRRCNISSTEYIGQSTCSNIDGWGVNNFSNLPYQLPVRPRVTTIVGLAHGCKGRQAVQIMPDGMARHPYAPKTISLPGYHDPTQPLYMILGVPLVCAVLLAIIALVLAGSTIEAGRQSRSTRLR